LRTFIALEIPQEGVLEELVSVQEELRKTQADLKLVSRENLHFTVKFLGEISEEETREINNRLKGLDLKSTQVSVEGVGSFPGLGRPSVIWAGVSVEDRAKVVPIAEQVISAVKGIGETDNRPYEPHITLARVRSPRNTENLASFIRQNVKREFGTVELKHLKLKSSELTPRGPIYSDIGVYPLK